jgi:phage tail-like protein
MTTELVAGPFTNGHSANNGHAVVERDARPDTLPSRYLRYLPEIYWQDPFIGRFLRIFEDILSPIQDTVNRRAELFDPALAADEMLRFIATWVGASEFGELPVEQTRGLVRKAVTLNRWRGTKHGLRMALEVATGKRPYINEYSGGLVLGEDAVLGLNTSLQEGRALQVHILFDCDENEIDSKLAHAIIHRYKPAGAVYTVSFVS